MHLLLGLGNGSSCPTNVTVYGKRKKMYMQIQMQMPNN